MQQEPSNADSIHKGEDVSYIAIPEGSWIALYDLVSGNGVRIEAGRFQTNKWLGGDVAVEAGGQWTVVTYYHPFNTPPVVFTQIQDYTYTGFAHTRIHNVGIDRFGTSPEPQGDKPPQNVMVTIGWVAVEKHVAPGFSEAGVKKNVDDVYTRIDFQQVYTQKPHVIAWMQTYEGTGSAGVRGSNLSTDGIEVCIEEDGTYDSEKDHVFEDVGYYAIRGDINNIYLQKYVDPPPTITIGSEVRLLIGGLIEYTETIPYMNVHNLNYHGLLLVILVVSTISLSFIIMCRRRELHM